MDISSDGLMIGNPFIIEEINYVPNMWGLSDIVITNRPALPNAISSSEGYLFLRLSIKRSTVLIEKDSGPEGSRIMLHPPS